MKKRHWHQGLILVSDSPVRFRSFVDMSDPILMAEPLSSWPGPYTWLLPKLTSAPNLIHGRHKTIAVRVSSNPIIKSICFYSGKAIVSTSANRAGRPSLKSPFLVRKEFASEVDYILNRQIGNNPQPSTIIDANTKKIIRT